MTKQNKNEIPAVSILTVVAEAVGEGVRRACRCAWLSESPHADDRKFKELAYNRLTVSPRRHDVRASFMHLAVHDFSWNPSDGLVLHLVTSVNDREIDFAGGEHQITAAGTFDQLASQIEDVILSDAMDLTTEAERAADERNREAKAARSPF
jgi:hypothetical protein